MSFIVSCKKEYVDFPYNSIEKFVIADNAKAEIKASIIDDKIIIYWPPLQTIPDSITPNILVSDRAKISPESGKKVAFNETTVYTVTAQDGSVKKYILSPSINQPLPAFEIINNTGITIGETMALTGENIITDTTKTRLYLVDKDKKEIQLYGSTFLLFTHSQIQLPIAITSAIDTGYYSFKLVTGLRQVTRGPYHVAKPALKVTIPAGTIVKRGNVLTIPVNPVIGKYNPVSYVKIYYPGSFTNSITITNVQQTSTAISVTIPSVFPITSSNSMQFFNSNNTVLGQWYHATAPITITD
ncbi:hypothetical protein [Pedobacter metabolipauper]|uniref:hypothetical protein n=1 Tax=Pedobacter metabolipauper TaxID=425513 RepID=UPI00105C9852|nr:hypothetical protein [Pedobacter metabolipauper]